MICVIHAHPYLSRSRTNRALADALRGSPDLDFRALYDLYPDFDIDVAAEQRALEQARLVVWMHPVFWYSVPALLKHWIDKVLAYGWAYGEGGTALARQALPVGADHGRRRAGLHAVRHPRAIRSRASCRRSSRPRASAACAGSRRTSCTTRTRSTTARLAGHVAALTERLAPWREPETAAVPEARP